MSTPGVKVAEFDTIIEYPIEKVKEAIQELGKHYAKNYSGLMLTQKDEVFGLFVFNAMIKASMLPTMGKINVNIFKENDTSTRVKLTSSFTNSQYDYASGIHASNMQNAQTNLLSGVSKILTGENIENIPPAKNTNGCLGIALLLVTIGTVLFGIFVKS
ncbi:hypothetical protein [Arachidicoccus soli]|uniref:Uncharacterized protein n=1 Tax=Arachidicoccus soli TaxID=2341117 RepID=A0A386HLP4_9BACT|nr:hypothetical protein [Arachidicoccus soli]AYD46673.1 hypothetical protein D6B99_03000 [Arachidicoccus soli]